jgi:hypothetical protein
MGLPGLADLSARSSVSSGSSLRTGPSQSLRSPPESCRRLTCFGFFKG